MKKNILLFIFLFGGIGEILSQDFHYSMFTMAPLTLNPALTGNFTGDLRIVNNYRMQWSSISKPFTTYTFGGDFPLPKFKKHSSSPDFFAAGININVDKAGSTSLKNNQFNVAFSYNKSLDGVGNTFFSFGFRAGLNQRSINMTGTSWDEQYVNLTYDPSLPTGEISSFQDHYYYSDFSTGVAITSVKNSRAKINGGIFADHLNRPVISFLGRTDKLYMKFGFHFSGQFAVGDNSNTWLVPAVEYVRQGPAQLINVGAGLKYQLQQRSHYTGFQNERAFTIGGMYRLGDAASAYLRIDLGPVGVAFNYDINVSSLTPASNGNGALEFMLIYTGIYKDQNSRLGSPAFF